MAKKHNSNIPSLLLILLCDAPLIKTSFAQINNTIEASTQRGISLLNVPFVTLIGTIAAVQPTIIKALNILLPTTLPIAISELPFKADTTLTVNSGAEVPNATIVSPITKLEILKRLATEAAPSVKALAPTKISSKPPISNTISISL